ncbi:DUF2935 domain-containing protein [Aneurinibacillus migulanus]|nr:DUF2935 domain-containing protein [Aneurinibacillus migulanus]MED0895041.1 DUF2935 domain-containing protein [Aneurinibacillus migulanus]MED1617981.1 DUF2935 domain-containing protein [Aneurinibacillus migulanus]MED4727754.1 DUF2935 domain-containing protein [Aneurinibacillus migulanus]CEH32288.1 Uncharacterized protein BN1090_A2_04807 [Aneurinibacillus migulanus]SDJ49167.1 protein of unknown function [Aneurinibacillus migulanus]
MSNLFVNRSLEEVQFWGRIMKEHALFLRLGFTVDQPKLIQEASHFHNLFESIEEKSVSFTDNADREHIVRLNMETYQATSHLWAFERKVLELILSCKIITNSYPLFVDHASREAAYFMNRIEQLNKGILEPLPDAVINENVFFLRIMSDHAKFISHLLDPSERNLITEAADLSYQLDQLLFQAVDLEAMRPASQTGRVLSRLIEESRLTVQSLYDFKRTIKEMVEECRLRSVIHPLLADHMLREAQRFLDLLDRFEASLTAGPKD